VRKSILIYKEISHRIAFVNLKSIADLYIRIRDDYRLFAVKGAELPEEQFQQMHKSGLKLYISGSDSAEIESKLDGSLLEVLMHPEVDPRMKADIAYGVSMKSIQEVFQGINARTLLELKKTSKTVAALISTDRRVMNHFMKISSSDHYTFKHAVKVGVYGTAMTINLFQHRIKYHDLDELSMAFFLHDIGMTKVPSSILDKNEPLNESDWETIQKHPVWGKDKLAKASYSSDETTDIILYHHERCDGSGYPFKKSGDEIPLYAKICAIADTFDSLTAGRPFKKAKTPFEALKTMQVEMAREFDPDLFRAFITMLGSGK
jgi:HD-GYP domain-containing protein (c-di-GMP phosphodiesterase class II)